LKHSPGFWRFAHEHWANAIRHHFGILGYALSRSPVEFSILILIGFWFLGLVFGFWFLVFGFWFLVFASNF
jgi:hypothetical protein